MMQISTTIVMKMMNDITAAMFSHKDFCENSLARASFICLLASAAYYKILLCGVCEDFSQ